MKSIKHLILTISLLSPFIVFGQFSGFFYNNSILVIKGTDTIPLAWAGGMNHPQFSSIDIDYDGKNELVAFEPGNGTISVFRSKIVNGQTVYSYVYDGASMFPSGIINRLQTYDYNHDGKMDLFTYINPDAIRVYENIGDATEGLQWKIVADPLISTDINSIPTNIYASDATIPALSDVDGDGDMDILTFATSRKIVEWHKNLSVETYGNPDSLIFKLQEPCWGDFAESTSGNGIVLHNTIAPCSTPISTTPDVSASDDANNEVVNINRHQGGGSILALDINGNGLKDLLIGDHDFDNLTLLVNGGTDPNLNANMTSVDAAFPSYNVPINLSNFLVGYYNDVNLDGVKDLIVSTNYVNNSDNTNGVWLYKNTATDDNPHFEFIKDDFLQGDMIENGKGSIPILVDVNNDGKEDLLVANDNNYADSLKTSRINYYQNVGTSSTPVFRLNNENWNGFSNSGLSGRVSPTFGDLDDDGDQDMIVGISNGKLYYYENAGGSGAMLFNIVQYQLQDYQGNNITVNQDATPELFDLNNDGKLDLIIASKDSPLLFYKNIGTTSNFSFQLVNNNLGQLSAAYQKLCVPRFFKTGGITYMFAGNSSGTVQLYKNVQNDIGVGSIFQLANANVAGINTKGMSAPIVGELRNNGTYDLFVGNQLGGLWNFTTDSTLLAVKNEKDFDKKSSILVYPNPNNGTFTLNTQQTKINNFSYQIVDPIGRIVYSAKVVNQQIVTIHLKSNLKGLFFIKVIANDNSHSLLTKKILIK